MNRLQYILLLITVVCFPISGQRIVPTPDDYYNDGVEFMYSGDYSDAVLSLLTLYEKGYRTANIQYLIGECYLNIPGQKNRAIPFLKNAAQQISNQYSGTSLTEEFAPVKTLLFLGIAYRLNYDFENALSSFDHYLQKIAAKDIENKRLAEFHIERCNNALELMAAPAKFDADTLTDMINSTASNFNPLITPDEKALFYTNQLKFYDAIMFTEKDDSGWISPENLTPLIKSDGDHYTTGITPDGKQLFLTSYDPYLTGEIFSTSLLNGEWSEMQKLNDNINTRFNETHASVSPDGNILYFTSDRKGGYGGLDIYRSAKNENGVWQQPVNLGPLINTPFNEESPFVTSDGNKLFFSSQGHYNMGGYDIFCSATGSDGNWLPPVNIGYPLNSTDDDLFYFPLDTGSIGYQSRFSNPSGQKDIIRYKVISFGKPARFIVNGNIELIADSGFNATSVQVTFIDRHENDTLDMKTLNDDGTFRQKLPGGSYSVHFSNAQKSLLTRNLDIPEYLPHNNLVLHEKIEVVSAIIADTFYLNDIRFDFNNSNIDQVFLDKLNEIANLMVRFPETTVHIDGYADALGHSDYNLKLTLQRANQVKNFLTLKLVPSSRISTNAMGENNPVAINTNKNGSDNAEGRRFNRRAEITIHNAPSSLVIIKVNDVPLNLLLKK